MTKAHACCFVAGLLFAIDAAHGASPPFLDLVAHAPLIQPQSDGVIYMDPEAAAILRWSGREAKNVNAGGGELRIEKGHFTLWDADAERPYWRVNIPRAGRYRVILNRSINPGRESTDAVFFWNSAGHHSVTSRVENTGGWGVFQPWEMGEIDLPAGEQVVEFRPVTWTDRTYLINMVDLRLIPLDDMRKTAPAAEAILKRVGIDSDPAVAAAKAKLDQAQSHLSALSKITHDHDFSNYSNYDQFFAYDQAASQMDDVEASVKAATQQVYTLRIERAKTLKAGRGFSQDDAKKVNTYLTAVATALEGATRDYPKVYYTAPAASSTTDAVKSGSEPLFPTGNFGKIPKQEIDGTLPVVQLPVDPPPDAAERRAKFAQRDSDAGIAELCQEFQRVLVPGTRGLENFEKLCQQGKYRDALAAYRTFFFDKLAHPDRYDADNHNLLFDLAVSRGKGELLRTPSAFAVEKNMNGAAVVQSGREVLVANVGEPGAVAWVPWGVTLSADDAKNIGYRTGYLVARRSPAGAAAVRKLSFFNSMTTLPSDSGEYQHGGFFPALLFAYTVNGNKECLDKWCAYADDWAINLRRDQNNFAIKTRDASELETQKVRCTLLLLRIMLDERPSLATDFNPATLARLMMKLTTDFAPYTIRARRAEMANWGIMGICHQVGVSRIMAEFKGMNYFNRESWRLWNMDFIQHRTLDGENVEAWDEGHNPIDIDYALQCIPTAKFPAGVDALDVKRFWDLVKNNERSLLVHMSPGGEYWTDWLPKGKGDLVHNTVSSRYTKANSVGRTYLDLIDHEPDARKRIETILSAGRPTQTTLPPHTSDIAPYAAMSYLRDSWMPDAPYMVLQNFVNRSQTDAQTPRTMYELSKSGRILIQGNSIAVDRKPDNRYYGHLVTGGKTDYCGEAGENVTNGRFLTSEQFDVTEGLQDAPYAQPRLRNRADQDQYNLYRPRDDGDDPDAIKDVTDLRQVFAVHGEGLYIVNDRIMNAGKKPHEYTQFMALPVRFNEQGLADRVRLLAAAHDEVVKVDPAARTLRTGNPGFDNVSAYLFGPSEMKFANKLDARGEPQALDTTPLQRITDDLKTGKAPGTVLQRQGIWPVSARWTGNGNQTLVTAIYLRPAVSNLNDQYAGDLKSIEKTSADAGVAGCHLVTRTGTEVWFQAGPQTSNHLTCGPVSAEAESLLVVRKTDGAISGVVLGCRSIRSTKGSAQATANGLNGDFEFSVAADGTLKEAARADRPIDTTRILPEQNVFTDQVNVSFDIPTQKTDDIEFRYTLDGTDPTLQSALFTGPIAIHDSTLVKVRPFRKGLKSTPWNIPGTQAGRTISAIFRKQAPLAAVSAADAKPGLTAQYFEGDWPTLFTYAGFDGVLQPLATHATTKLLDPAELSAWRKTDRAYAVRYEGTMTVPTTGVYAFYAPSNLYEATQDAGYDLRVFVDGHEWFPSPTLHARGVWFVALSAGAHHLKVSYADYRWKTFRDEYAMSWQAEEMGTGTPVLEVSGPGVQRQALPSAWLHE